jgi:hypothetical protein
MELNAQAIGIIGVVVSGAVGILKQFMFPRNYALLACAVLSLTLEMFYVWSQGTFTREGAWSLLAGFFAIYGVAVGTYETVKATGMMDGQTDAGRSRLGALAMLVAMGVIVSMAMAAGACGKRYVEGTKPSAALAYEMEEGLKVLVDAQAQVIAAVDADPSFKPTADRFLNPVRDILKLSKEQIIPRLKQFDAALAAADLVRQGELRGELGPLFEDFNRIVGQAFGVTLPDHVVASANSLVRSYGDLKKVIQDLIKDLRTDLAIAQ